MTQPRTIRALACTLALLAAATPSPAFAYLDPGFASLVLQGIIGAIAAAGVVAGMYWNRLTAFFRRDKPSPEEKKEPDTRG